MPLIVLLILLVLTPAAKAQSKIQPGAMLRTEGGQCTLNFVFDGLGANAGKVYVGTAAHCGEKVGDQARDENDEAFGHFAFFGDPGQEGEAAIDYAFIQVSPDHASRVDPAMKGHPQYPTGFTTPEETQAGDLIQMSGYGVGFGETQPTREGRQTILQSDDTELYTLSGPSVNGDSGGPFVHVRSGKALGVVSQYGFFEGSTDVGPTIQSVIAKATAAGFTVTLRAAGQAAPVVPPPPPPPSATEPAPQPAAPAQSSPPPPPKAKKKKSARQKRCERRAKRIKSKRKRRAALKRCARRR